MVKLVTLRKDLLSCILSYNTSEEKLEIAKTCGKLSECSFKMISELNMYEKTSIKFIKRISENIKTLTIKDLPSGLIWKDLCELNLSSLIEWSFKALFKIIF